MANQTGVVTANPLNLRQNPAADSPLLGTLARGTRLEILAQEGAWYHVSAGGLTGYVHGDWVRILETNPAAGFLHEREDLKAVPLTPADADKIQVKSSFNATQKLVANTWNAQGGLLGKLSDVVQVDPAAATAVFCVESSGRGFADDGRMIIRFENHVFWEKWGKDHADDFNGHFRFNKSKSWLGHQFCATAGGAWADCHKAQNGEWEVFGFARALDEPNAIRSISMGGPQIMGYNHHAIGYETPRAMFDNFQADLRYQILGFFDFVKGSGTTSQLLEALRRQRFEDFALRYNGPGQVTEYGSRIRGFCEALQGLR